MSILDALHQVRNQDKSLESLASLPQTLIMNMVQRKEIPETDLPMIMAKKAEMAQTAANLKAAQAQQQQQPGSIMEKLMAQNAAADAAKSAPPIEEQTQVGIASNPTPEMQFAGGGIVAFAEGDLVNGKSWDDMTQEEKDAYIASNPALQRSIAMGNLPSKFGDFLSKYNPISGTAYRESLSNFFNEKPEDQATRFRSYSNRTAQAQNPTKEVPAMPTASQRTEAQDMANFDNATALFEKERAAKTTPTANDGTTPVTISERKLNSKYADSKLADIAKAKEDQAGILDEYKKLYAEDKEASRAAREEAKWSRIMEAGLNIMGGESPYAFANIGKGAAAASKGYAEDIKGLRAEERDRNKQLAALGIKEKELGLENRKLGITEQHYKDWANMESKKIGILAQKNIDDKMAQGVNNIFAQLLKKYDPLLSDGSMTESDLYQKAQEMYTSTTGKGMKGSPSTPTSNTLSWSSLNKGK
jgi:hypothetical protein